MYLATVYVNFGLQLYTVYIHTLKTPKPNSKTPTPSIRLTPSMHADKSARARERELHSQAVCVKLKKEDVLIA